MSAAVVVVVDVTAGERIQGRSRWRWPPPPSCRHNCFLLLYTLLLYYYIRWPVPTMCSCCRFITMRSSLGESERVYSNVVPTVWRACVYAYITHYLLFIILIYSLLNSNRWVITDSPSSLVVWLCPLSVTPTMYPSIIGLHITRAIVAFYPFPIEPTRGKIQFPQVLAFFRLGFRRTHRPYSNEDDKFCCSVTFSILYDAWLLT